MILLDRSHDGFHGVDTPGGYEWTYVDGMSDDGLDGFTAIWFRGLPMSPYYTSMIDGDRARALPSRYCGFAFNLYERGRTVAATFDEGDASRFDASAYGPDVRFGSNRLRVVSDADGLQRMEITIDGRTPFLGHRISGEIVGTWRTIEPEGMPIGSFDPTAGDYWVPVAADGSYSSEISLRRFGGKSRAIRSRGRLYHDRNLGFSPLHENDVRWQWGRVHLEKSTAIFFAVEPTSTSTDSASSLTTAPFHSLMLVEEGRVVRALSTASTVMTSRPHWTGLPAPRSLIVEAEGARLTSRTIGLLHSGPFYHRMRSHVTLEWEGEHVEGIGVSEYLRPSRLGVGFFRPFVACRVRREVGSGILEQR